MLGTILPNGRQLAAADKFADRESKVRQLIGDKELKGCDRRVVGGEVRYYDTTDQYAIVSRQGKILWFVVTADGDKRISR
jgi:hypothetical protein